jgi:hypothetical protein
MEHPVRMLWWSQVSYYTNMHDKPNRLGNTELQYDEKWNFQMPELAYINLKFIFKSD